MRPEKQTLASARAAERSFLTLVIPTRNEVGNVPRLVRELGEALSGVDYRVVFVDDSTDRTPTCSTPPERCARCSRRYGLRERTWWWRAATRGAVAMPASQGRRAGRSP